MNLRLEKEFSKAPILEEVDALKKQIDDMRPLPADVEGRVMQKLRLDWNYNSNAIEGNKLSYGETVAFLMEGITAKGKPLKDHLDIRGHNQAINFLLDLVKDTRPISEADIRALHEMILVEPYEVKAQTAEGLPTTKWIKLGEYKVLPNHVQTATGETHYYISPEETPIKMGELMDWYNEVSEDQEIHPVVAAALFHHKFVAIHPFDDGNGRLSRILMNLTLMQKGYPPVVVKMDDRKNYYSLLSRADVGDNWPFIEYVAERLQSSLQLYFRAANGGDIDEDEDIDKQIALHRIELLHKIKPKKKVSRAEIDATINNITIPFLNKLNFKLSSLYRDVFEVFKIIAEVSPDMESYKYMIANKLTSMGDYYVLDHIIWSMSFNKRISSIYLTVNLEGFKNPDNTFDASGSIEFRFEDEEYSITDTNKLKVYKHYGEKLSKEDENNIISELIENIKYLIDHNSQI